MFERLRYSWMPSANTNFVSGAQDCLPLAISIIPFGMILAAPAVSTGFSPLRAVVMGTLIFGGVAQAAMIDLVGQTTSIGVIISTGSVVNLR